jgi:hypothetical protein
MRALLPRVYLPGQPLPTKALPLSKTGGNTNVKGALPFEYVSGTYIRQS